MPNLIERPNYLQQLIAFKDTQIIKIVTGIRRCGKSTLFDLYCEYLRSIGVKDSQIIRINLEDPDFGEIDRLDFYGVCDMLNILEDACTALAGGSDRAATLEDLEQVQ